MGAVQNVPHLLASISALVYIGTLGCGRERWTKSAKIVEFGDSTKKFYKDSNKETKHFFENGCKNGANRL